MKKESELRERGADPASRNDRKTQVRTSSGYSGPLTLRKAAEGLTIVARSADTGEMVLEENFRDFKEFDQRNYDEILGLFENLRSLETQLVGIFVSQEMSANRYVFQ